MTNNDYHRHITIYQRKNYDVIPTACLTTYYNGKYSSTSYLSRISLINLNKLRLLYYQINEKSTVQSRLNCIYPGTINHNELLL